MNYDSKRDKTYGQLINHSSLHSNAIPRTYVTEKGKLEIIFVHNVTLKLVRRYCVTIGKIIMV